MRISDDRYRRDRRAFDLAWRLLGHGARTGTISRWTGFGERRIRTLQRSYRDEKVGSKATRPRGRSPYRIELLLQSAQQRQEVTELARMLYAAGVIPPQRVPNADELLPSIARGELLCEVFEEYRNRFPASAISIEQTVLTVLALARREEVDLGSCLHCQRLLLIDRLDVRPLQCDTCGGPVSELSALPRNRGPQSGSTGGEIHRD